MKRVSMLMAFILILVPRIAMATQSHGDPEGIYAHQLSHVFFMASMMMLIYWVRQKKLIFHKGWRYIQYAAFFFILWNLDVVLVHFLDEQFLLVTVEKISDIQMKITSRCGKWAQVYYYLGKMDHLLCVPALIFLFAGLKRLPTDLVESPETKMP